MKLSIHQESALLWCLAAPGPLSLAIEESTLPNVRAVIAWGVVVVTAMILLAPALLRWPTFRRWYCWTDALSEHQRESLAQRNLRRYYQAAFEHNYVTRVVPYLSRFFVTTIALLAVTRLLPRDAAHPCLSAFAAFSAFYPLGIMMLIVASLPLSKRLRTPPGKQPGRAIDDADL